MPSCRMWDNSVEIAATVHSDQGCCGLSDSQMNNKETNLKWMVINSSFEKNYLVSQDLEKKSV